MDHKSYQEYLDQIISLVPDNMEPEFIIEYKNQLLPLVEKHWGEYVCGKRDNYFLSDTDIEEAWTKTNIQLVENALIKLSKLELVEMSINANGEIVYGISEKGKDYLEKLNDQ